MPAIRSGTNSTAYLVTLDDELWPQVGAHLTHKLTHRQLDSIDELLGATRPEEAAVVLWDARGAADQSAALTRLLAHSSCFAVVALDVAESASGWAAGDSARPGGRARRRAGRRRRLWQRARQRLRRGERPRRAARRGRGGRAANRRFRWRHASRDGRRRRQNRVLGGAPAKGRGTRTPLIVAAGGLALAILGVIIYFFLQGPAAVPGPTVERRASRQSPDDPVGTRGAAGTGGIGDPRGIADPGVVGGELRRERVVLSHRGEGRRAHQRGADRHARSALHRAGRGQCVVALSQRAAARSGERRGAAGPEASRGDTGRARAIGPR